MGGHWSLIRCINVLFMNLSDKPFMETCVLRVISKRKKKRRKKVWFLNECANVFGDS